MSQLILDLGHRPALAREDFLVAASNEVAVAWVDRWPDWPQPLLTVYGAAGCGKTHLAEVWRRASGAKALMADDLLGPSPIGPPRRGEALLFDGLDLALRVASALEEPLLHLYNRLRDAGGTLLATAEGPPAQWGVGLADLRSRLAAGPAVELGAPDDRLMQAVLFKLFADRQLSVTQEALDYLVKRMERSFAEARRLVDLADRAALAARRSITIPLLRDVLERQQASGDR